MLVVSSGSAQGVQRRNHKLTDQEGWKLQQVVRRGSTSSVRYRWAMMLPASAGGNTVSVIARLVAADDGTVRNVIHRFNGIGPTCLEPHEEPPAVACPLRPASTECPR